MTTNPSDPNLVDHRQLQPVPPVDRRNASPLTLAVVMAAIAGFFIAGIASAFIYSKDSSLTRTAQAPLPPPAVYAPGEMTGSGSAK
jgi:hypothetical protein